MRIAKVFLLVGGIMITTYLGWILVADQLPRGTHAASMPMNAFIIGTWQSETEMSNGQGSYTLIDRLEFVPPRTLIQDQLRIYPDHSRTIDLYNIKSQYRFVSGTHINITGRNLEDWILAREGENLQIERGQSGFPTGIYKRLTTVQWPIFAGGLAALLTGIFLSIPQPLKQIYRSKSNVDQPDFQHEARSPLSRGLRATAVVCVLAVGIWAGIYIWGKWAWLLISLPWDAIILLEINLMLLVVGIGEIMRVEKKMSLSALLARRPLSYIGVLLVSISATGILVGSGYLLLYVILRGTYGSGA